MADAYFDRLSYHPSSGFEYEAVLRCSCSSTSPESVLCDKDLTGVRWGVACTKHAGRRPCNKARSLDVLLPRDPRPSRNHSVIGSLSIRSQHGNRRVSRTGPCRLHRTHESIDTCPNIRFVKVCLSGLLRRPNPRGPKSEPHASDS